MHLRTAFTAAPARPARRPLRSLGACSLLLLAPLGAALGCHSGTAAAPMGSMIIMDFDYVHEHRNFDTGDFEATISVQVLDSVSNVPQVGVGVFFRVESGPGRFVTTDAVRTTGGGYAQNILVATGALPGREVTMSAFSGEAEPPPDLILNVNGGTTEENLAPTASFTVSPASPTTTTDVTVDVSASSDPECPNMDPESWTVDWGDNTANEDFPFSDPQATHRYRTAGSYTIEVTVTDCQGGTDTATRSITVS